MMRDFIIKGHILVLGNWVVGRNLDEDRIIKYIDDQNDGTGKPFRS